MLGLRSILLTLFTIAICCDAKLPEEEQSDRSPNRESFSRVLDLMGQFNLLNNDLEKGVKTDSHDANFKFIDTLVENKSKRWSWFKKEDPEMDRALALFKSLQQVNESEQCNLKAYNILSENFNAANGLARWGLEKDLAERRVNKIVREVAEKHAQACSPKYFDLYRANVVKVDPDHKEFAITLLKNMIYKQYGQEKGEEVLGDPEKLLEFALDSGKPSTITGEPAFWLSEMRRLTKGDPNSKYLEPQPTEYLGKQILEVDDEELQKLYKEYIQKPCREYVMKLETVFMPADFDTHYLVTPAKQDELDYYLDWAAFSLCDLMVVYDLMVPYYIAVYANRMAKEGKPF